MESCQNVRVIVAEEKVDCEHLLGTFLDDSHYDEVINEDCDFYAPAEITLFGEEDAETEEKCIFKLRKGFFSKEDQNAAYSGLIGAAGASQNRGMAAGARQGKLLKRDWVTDAQQEVLKWMLNPTYSVIGDTKQEIIDKAKNDQKSISKGSVWLVNQVGKDFDFVTWVEETLQKSNDEIIEAAKEVSKGVSTTSYANEVNSGIAGWFDRYPRIPYGRPTAYTHNNPDSFKLCYPFLQKLSEGFKGLLPERFEKQMNAANSIDPSFRVPETPFTTITVNKTFRTAAHRDAGDLNSGFSNLSVITNREQVYTGGYLVLPEFRIAVNIRPGDLLLINNHDGIHGNTEIDIEEGGERMSIVCYFREKMLELGEREYEDARYNFVEKRRKDETHPNWHKGWNGVSPSMWTSTEWYEYLKEQMGEDKLYEYHPEAKLEDNHSVI